MPLISANIVPHSPLLIDTVGDKEDQEKIKKTYSSMETIRENLEKLKPDTIIIISPKINNSKNSFYINISENFHADFKEFGEFKTTLDFKGDIGLVLKLKNSEKNENVNLITKSKIDYETYIPLNCLMKNIKPRIIPIECSNLSLKHHFEFGKDMKEAIFESNKKIAIIVSAHLSHKSSKQSLSGYTRKAQEFDKKIVEFLESKNKTGFLGLKESVLKDVQEYGIRPIAILLGILNEVNYEPKNLSYENPFGIGYLTMNFKI